MNDTSKETWAGTYEFLQFKNLLFRFISVLPCVYYY